MYVVTGATGNTGQVVAQELLQQGKKVRVIGRSMERLQPLVAQGAEAVALDLGDAAGLTRAMFGATAVYAMMPPNLSTRNFAGYTAGIIDTTAAALEQAAVGHVVLLSSFGADKPRGTGPVAALHAFEERLNRVSKLKAIYLRTGYFMENTLAQIQLIKGMGICAGPLRPDLKLPMIATQDIGKAAAGLLLKLDFEGCQPRELLGQRDITMTEVATIIGAAIGKPSLNYIHAPDEQVRPALVQVGMSPEFAGLILEMSGALNSGHMRALEPRSEQNTTSTSYETFVANEFVPRYRQATMTAA